MCVVAAVSPGVRSASRLLRCGVRACSLCVFGPAAVAVFVCVRVFCVVYVLDCVRGRVALPV